MSLAPGARLGPYEVLSAIGAGGMGEVYRARDTRLNRDVAIKILPEHFAADTDRVARFQREARILASLNHPNIAHIHGLEETSDGSALILELVEGPSLADRIAQGPIPLDEALPIARQIAEALEAAHEHGIIHRDLKPANIKLTSDGTVKVLDFGLAKSADTGSVRLQPDLSTSPTITSPAMTMGGVILGTAAYMSPEQARGKAVDRRADIWAFGCVLFEMLVGRRAFEDDDVSMTLSKVLQREADFDALPTSVPARVRQALRVCLRKDPKQRMADIRDVRLALEGAFESDILQRNDAAVFPSASYRVWIAAAVVCLLAAVAVSIIHFREDRPSQQILRYQISAPENETILSFALSPNGQHLAFTTGRFGTLAATNFNRLWVRPLDSLEAEPLRGTEGAVTSFWSPDGRSIGFFAGGKLKRVDLLGGPPQIVCDAPLDSTGAWNRAGNILFTGARGTIYEVIAESGEAQPVTTLDTSRQEVIHRFPQFLPDGRHFVYTAFSSVAENSAVYAASLDSDETTRLLPNNGNVVYSEDAAGQGYLMFLRGEALLAQRFEAAGLELEGEPLPLAQNVAASPFVALGRLGQFSSSASGILSYQRGLPAATELVWFDRSGQRSSRVGEPAGYSNVALSPDERRVAVSRQDPRLGTRDVWIVDLSRGFSTQLTFDRGDDMNPVWSPEGNRIAFSSSRSGPRNIYVKDANGTGDDQALFESDVDKSIADWSPDGRYVIWAGGAALPLHGERKPIPFPPGISNPRVSPDGRWLGYQSAESGRLEIYVQSFPALLAGRSAGKWRVSTAGGIYPEWRRDGHEIFYLAPDSTLMAVRVHASGPAFEPGPPTPLFPLGLEAVNRRAHYQPAANGQRFLVVQPVEQSSSNPITVLVNWTAGLGR